MKKILGLVAICMLVLFTGCTTAQRQRLNAKRPEISIRGTPEQIRNALVDKMLDRGFRVVNSDPMNLVMEKRAESVLASALYGSRYDTDVYSRARFTIVKNSDEECRVVASLDAVSNRGSALEHEEPLEGDYWLKMQTYLETVKAKVESEK